ncbi:YwaF family protein [Vallitalea okinawensis]|uniref:YwaF family protein n=1 Tax=Vallitalea okinawensis TaxID=2078660 RepID=UPI000CFAC028|nr:TIGR02206 family membrane protein [Vallitalea okinawensis]
MKKLFMWTGDTPDFHLLSLEHIAGLMSLLAIYFIIVHKRENIRSNQRLNTYLQVIAGALMIIQEIALNIWRYQMGLWSLASSLPLHLCSLALMIGPFLYITKSQKLFDLLYYWSFGAFVAILTPDIGTTGFPSFRYYQFFLSHGLILFQVIYMMTVLGMRPSTKSLKTTLIYTNIIMLTIGMINFMVGGNYFFIARKPETASFMDLLGPWPVYIIFMELIAWGIFMLMYLPFRRRNVAKSSVDV